MMNIYSKVIDSYKIAASTQEIAQVLSKAHEANLSIMWQKFSAHRTIYNIEDFKLGGLGNIIRITFQSSKEVIDPKLPVYVKIPFRETVFKGKVSHINEHGLFISIPSKIHMRDFRESARITFDIGRKFADLRPSLPNKNSENISVHKVCLEDISQNGLGVLVSESSLKHFKKGKHFELIRLEESFLIKCLLGEVVYVSKQGQHYEKAGKLFKIGIRLLSPIPEEIFRKIIII